MFSKEEGLKALQPCVLLLPGPCSSPANTAQATSVPKGNPYNSAPKPRLGEAPGSLPLPAFLSLPDT